MAKITITVEGTTVGTVTIEDTLDQSNSDRFFAWLARNHGKDSDGNDRTAAEMVSAVWTGIRTGMFANVKRDEQVIAAQTASEAVSDLQSTTEVTAS